VAHAFRAFIREHPGLYALMAPAARTQTPVDPETVAAEDEAVSVVLAVLEPYHMDRENAIHAVRALRSVVHGFATLEASGGFGLPLDCDRSFEVLVRMLIAGLRALAMDGRGPATANGSQEAAARP
jgi:hypothetical protein